MTIRHLLSCSLFCLMSMIAFSQNDCQQFRTGTFQTEDNGEFISVVNRNDSLQIERMGPIEVTLRVTWTDDCTYRLSFKDGNTAFWEAVGSNAVNPDMIVHITKVKRNGYHVEATALDGQNKVREYFLRVVE